jgi:hypothetical protein
MLGRLLPHSRKVPRMCMSSPKAPAAPPPPAPPPEAPKESDAVVTGARDDAKRKARMAAGAASTILTGAMGAPGTAATAGKTLLGQ